nr:MAG TPA: hypothetical protein [Caudoviricetes sp.]
MINLKYFTLREGVTYWTFMTKLIITWQIKKCHLEKVQVKVVMYADFVVIVMNVM